jgi:hypothetical protein
MPLTLIETLDLLGWRWADGTLSSQGYMDGLAYVLQRHFNCSAVALWRIDGVNGKRKMSYLVRMRNAELTVTQELERESARLARIRYQEGAESLLGVLEAERTSLTIEQQLVMSKRDSAALTACCNIAMAGGFERIDASSGLAP